MRLLKPLALIPVAAMFFIGVQGVFAQSPEIDLQVQKTVDNATPLEGATVSYTLSVHNAGPDQATGVEITDELPVGTTFSSSDAPSHGTVTDPGAGEFTLVWDLGALDSGTTAELVFHATVDADTAGDTLSNTAMVTAVVETDTDDTNDSASADFTVGEVDLAIVKGVDDQTPSEGDPIVYTLVVSNESDNDATGVSITDTLPDGIVFNALIDPLVGVATTPVTGANTSILWELDLGAGENASLSIEATIDAGTSGSTITNTASIDAVTEFENILDNNSSSVDLTVGEAPPAVPEEEGQRRAFVGTVINVPEDSVTIEKQGTGEEIVILLPEEYELKTPGGPRADTFGLGARIVAQVQQVGEDWVAIKILVKPLKPNLPLTGVVVSVENGVVTIMLRDGTLHTFELPEGMEEPVEGEVVTAFQEKPGKAKGLVKAAKIQERLEKHLGTLTDEEPTAEEGEEEVSKRVAALIKVLEKHNNRRVGIMDEVLDRVPEHARAKVERAKANVERGRSKAIEAIERAKNRFGDEVAGNSNRGPKTDKPGKGNKPGTDEPEEGTGEEEPATVSQQGNGNSNRGGNSSSSGGSNSDNSDRGNSGGGKDKDKGNSGGKGKN